MHSSLNQQAHTDTLPMHAVAYLILVVDVQSFLFETKQVDDYSVLCILAGSLSRPKNAAIDQARPDGGRRGIQNLDFHRKMRSHHSGCLGRTEVHPQLLPDPLEWSASLKVLSPDQEILDEPQRSGRSQSKSRC